MKDTYKRIRMRKGNWIKNERIYGIYLSAVLMFSSSKNLVIQNRYVIVMEAKNGHSSRSTENLI